MKQITQPRLFVIAMSVSGMLFGGPAVGEAKESREYKLMLATSSFRGAEPAINNYWTERLNPLIDRVLGRKSGGDSRAEGRFSLEKQRVVRFFDTPNCQLRRNGYVFRKRVDAPGGIQGSGPEEGTLKFRSPDRLISAEARLENEDKFEEDISPVIARAETGEGEFPVLVNHAAVMRSQYASSAKAKIGNQDDIKTIHDVLDHFGETDDPLEGAHEDAQLKLVSDFTAFERVYEGAEVDLGKGVDAEFALTLWYDHASGQLDQPVIAELSFAYDLDQGEDLDPNVPRRAKDLFAALQSPDAFFSPASDTKTTFAYNLRKFCP